MSSAHDRYEGWGVLHMTELEGEFCHQRSGKVVVLKGRRRLDGLTAQKGEEGIGRPDGLTGEGVVWTA